MFKTKWDVSLFGKGKAVVALKGKDRVALIKSLIYARVLKRHVLWGNVQSKINHSRSKMWADNTYSIFIESSSENISSLLLLKIIVDLLLIVIPWFHLKRAYVILLSKKYSPEGKNGCIASSFQHIFRHSRESQKILQFTSMSKKEGHQKAGPFVYVKCDYTFC